MKRIERGLNGKFMVKFCERGNSVKNKKSPSPFGIKKITETRVFQKMHKSTYCQIPTCIRIKTLKYSTEIQKVKEQPKLETNKQITMETEKNQSESLHIFVVLQE